MPFKKQTTQPKKSNQKYKHVVLLIGYEFRDMKTEAAVEYLNKNNIYHDASSNIYEDGVGNTMYQLAAKIYDNEQEIIETKIADGVYLISHVYKFIHQDKKWRINY